jgi:hypothetical protein
MSSPVRENYPLDQYNSIRFRIVSFAPFFTPAATLKLTSMGLA